LNTPGNSVVSALHCIFGLRVGASQPIPGLDTLPPEPPFDVEICFGECPPGLNGVAPSTLEPPWYVSPDHGVNGLPCSRVWRVQDGRYFYFLYDDGTECFVERAGARIWMRWREEFSFEEVLPYLLGQALGLAQRLRGTVCFHASAILLGDRAIAVLGPARAGKSSTAAAFLQRGYRVLADDVVPVLEQDGSFFVRPAHPRIWLCPDMVEKLYGSPDALPQLTPGWEKRYLDLRQQPQGFVNRTAPLAAIYRLNCVADGQEPRVRALPARAALIELVSNTYVNHLLELELRAEEFAFLGRLVRTVPVRQIDRLRAAPETALLCEAILNDYQAHVGHHPVKRGAS
jgi:hypothetical protein